MDEAGITDYSQITKLTVITEDNAWLDHSYFSEPFDNDKKLSALLKENLEEADFSGARFGSSSNPDLLPPGGAESGEGAAFMPGFLKLKKVVLPEGLRLISGNAFRGCTALTTVVIPESVVNIGAWAFYQCSNIQIDKLPDSLEKIGDNAFNETPVSFSYLPESCRQIGTLAFRNTNVSFTKLPDAMDEETSITNRTNDNKYFAASVFVNCDGITFFTIPQFMGKVGIPDRTFYPKTADLARTFICDIATPPTVTAGSGSSYKGSFGTGSPDNTYTNVTIYVPKDAVDTYKAKSPYNTMTVLPIYKQTEDIASVISFVGCEDEAPVTITNVFDSESNIVGETPLTDSFYGNEPMFKLTPAAGYYIEAVDLDVPSAESEVMAVDGEGDETVSDKMKNNLYLAPYGDLKELDGVPAIITVPTTDGVMPAFTVKYDKAEGWRTGVESVAVTESNYQRVYNLSGVCVAEGEVADTNRLAPGIYILKDNKGTKKIIK